MFRRNFPTSGSLKRKCGLGALIKKHDNSCPLLRMSSMPSMVRCVRDINHKLIRRFMLQNGILSISDRLSDFSYVTELVRVRSIILHSTHHNVVILFLFQSVCILKNTAKCPNKQN